MFGTYPAAARAFAAESLEQRLFFSAAVPFLKHAASALSSLAGEYVAFRAKHPSGQFTSQDRSLSVSNAGVAVEAFAQPGQGATLQNQLRSQGMSGIVRQGGAVSGRLPLGAIDKLDSLAALRFVQPVWAFTQVGATTSQGDASLHGDIARNTFGISGAGVKVGIVSDSFNTSASPVHYADDIASGDLPAGVQILSDYTDPSPSGTTSDNPTDEGRAMAQTVYDTAPGVSLAFASGYGGQSAMASSIRSLRDAGAKVIVDDIIYLAEPMFQDGLIAKAVGDAVNSGVTYFSAAGNNARQAYDSTFRTGVARDADAIISAPGAPPFRGGVSHDFNPGPGVDDLQSFTLQPGQGFAMSFQWDQPYFSATGVGPGSASDMDVYVLNAAGDRVLAGAISSNVGNDPIEVLSLGNSGTSALSLNLMIVNYAGTAPTEMKYAYMGNVTFNEYTTSSGALYGHANSGSAAGVGAAPWFLTPAFGTSPASLESYSSAGGTPIYFSPTGTRLASPQARSQPRFVAPDGGNTTFFSTDIAQDADTFGNFFGTSAAAPAAAGVAALMLGAAPSLTPAMIYSTLQNTASDMDDSSTVGFDVGRDDATGYGLIQADAALDSILPRVQGFTVNGGAQQRSKVSEAVVTFTIPVTLDAGAFDLAGIDGAGAGTLLSWTNPSADQRTFVLTFSGSPIVDGSLADGVYNLTVVASKVHAIASPQAAMIANATTTFHRLFGDFNGDKTVNNSDAFKFAGTYLMDTADSGYLNYFDYTGNGIINNADAFQFSRRYLVILP